jgi:subtilisin family serine protease
MLSRIVSRPFASRGLIAAVGAIGVAVLGVIMATGMFGSAEGAQAGTTQTYIVLYKQQAVPANAAGMIEEAGGTLVHSYDAIGVAIAESTSSSFSSKLQADNKVDGVSSTAAFGVKVESDFADAGPPPGDLPNAPVDDTLEPLWSLQWDMRQIHVPEAHEITGGSPSIVVGDIDTGLDFTHPDIAPNYDAANSVDCSSGAPTPLLPGNDHVGHGTHTAGTIAAAANGIGIVGVAPNVKIAGIKSSNDDGFFFPEMVICSFMWAGSHGIDVTNNSYFADPWLFNCRNDAEQRAIWKAEQRAIRYAMQQGVVVVASNGNENQDLSKQNVDDISPDFPPGSAIEREVTNACVRIPVEIPGVIGVSANGNLLQKSYYSDYGVGVTQVVAPGGDRRFQLTAEAPNGRVLSTWPAALAAPSPLIIQDPGNPGAWYAYLQGTSMAGPHVAGVAALVMSQFGEISPGRVQAYITSTADPQPCPPNPFDPGGTGDFLATCQGGDNYNGFYGHGQVNALSAVIHSP